MASADFEHVEKTYPNGTHAIVDCTLHVDDGELMVLVGPSGCGKSTLLRLLAGLETVSSGTLRIGDQVVNDLTPQARNVAMVFQDYALYPFMSVRRNLEFPLKMRTLPREEVQRRIDWVAQLLDLRDLLDRLPKQLSGGQRQRVAMGRALVREPAVSMLDEPLSNLDATLRVQVRAEIADLQRRTGTTMVYVTHDQVEAMTLGHRVAVLNAGRLQQVAPPRVLYDHPVNTFVAGFIGSPPMNLFPARVVADGRGELILKVGDQTLPLGGRRDLPSLQQRSADAPLTAGIRPEAFRLATEPGGLSTTVEHVEYLGHETLAHLHLADAADGARLIARLEGVRELTAGETVRLQSDPQQIHFFGADGVAVPEDERA